MNAVQKAMFRAGRFLQKRSGFGIGQLDQAMEMALDSMAGVTNVSSTSALRVSTVWACINILADDIAASPLMTFMETEGGREEAKGHYLWTLLQQEVNPQMTAYRFKHLMQTWLCLWGNAYAEIVISGRGQVTELWPWRPDRVKVAREGNRLTYTYRMEDGTTITAPQDRILHLRGLGTDGVMGLSPIEMHKKTIGMSLAMTEHGNKYFTNGARPLGVLEHPGKLSDPAHKALRKSWEDRHMGVDNAYRVAILEEGMKYHEVGHTMVESQYLDAANLSVYDICRIFKVPPHRVAQLERSTNNNIEHQGLEYVIYTMGPIGTNWTQELEFSLLSPRERETVQVAFDFSHLIQGDMKSQAEYYSTLCNSGILVRNEARRKLKYNPLPGNMANIPWIQGAMVPADERPAQKIPAGGNAPSQRPQQLQ